MGLVAVHGSMEGSSWVWGGSSCVYECSILVYGGQFMGLPEQFISLWWGQFYGSRGQLMCLGGQCYYCFHNGHVVTLPFKYHVCVYELVEFST